MNKSIKKLMAGILMAACITGAVTGCGTTNKKNDSATGKITLAVKRDRAAGVMNDALPFPRFMRMDGIFYSFLEEGMEFKIDKSLIGDLIGTIDKEIDLEKEINVNEDMAATYAVGGKVYEFKNHNKEFRVLVEKDGKYFILENTSKLAGGNVAVSDYFKMAKLGEITEKIDIMDHFKRDVLKSVDKEKSLKMIEELSKSEWIKIDYDLFEKTGAAQMEGKSFLLAVDLGDGTTLDMYLIPSLKTLAVANETFKLTEDFLKNFGELFEGLKQQEGIVY